MEVNSFETHYDATIYVSDYELSADRSAGVVYYVVVVMGSLVTTLVIIFTTGELLVDIKSFAKLSTESL